jgi:hypothetical protein
MENFINQFRIHNKTVADRIEKRCGYVIEEDLPAIIAYDRLKLLLVRCGNGRFLCAAQDVAHFVALIEEHSDLHKEKTGYHFGPNTDYVRDISIPA